MLIEKRMPSLLLMILLMAYTTDLSILEQSSNCINYCRECEQNDPSSCIDTPNEEYCISSCKELRLSKTHKECIRSQVYELAASKGYSQYDSSLNLALQQNIQQLQGWQKGKLTKCQLRSGADSFQKTISVLGPFTLSTQVKKTFLLGNNLHHGLLTFNLLFDEWIPFDDFMFVQIYSQGDKLYEGEIYHDYREKIDRQTGHVKCNGGFYKIKKYAIKMNLAALNYNHSLTIAFKSYKESMKEQWAVTNIDLRFTCGNWASLSHQGACDKCDTGLYLDTESHEGGCRQCPQGCYQCHSEEHCYECDSGYVLNEKICQLLPSVEKVPVVLDGPEESCAGTVVFTKSANVGDSEVEAIFSKPISFDSKYKKCKAIYHLIYPRQKWLQTKQILTVQFNGKTIQQVKRSALKSKGNNFCQSFASDVSIELLEIPEFDCDNQDNILHFSSSGEEFGIMNVLILHGDTVVSQKKVSKTGETLKRNKIRVQFMPIRKQVNDQTGFLVRLTSKTPIHLQRLSIFIKQLQPPKVKFSQVQNINSLNKIIFIPLQQSYRNLNMQILSDHLSKNSSGESPSNKGLTKVASEGHLLKEFNFLRYDNFTFSELSAYQRIDVFLQIFAWICIIAMVGSTMLGCGVVVEQYLWTLQLLFLHAYIYPYYLPENLRMSLKGLSAVENINYFPDKVSSYIETIIMGSFVENSPLRFMQFNTDINFLRAMLPLFFLTAFYVLWFLFCKVVGRCKPQLNIRNESKVNKVYYNIVGNPFGYFEQIWRQQFLAVMWMCMLQFHHIALNHKFKVTYLSIALCFLYFIGYMMYLIGSYMVISRHYYQQNYTEFYQKYQDLFFRKLPKNFLPTGYHFGYRLIQFFKLFMYVLAASLFGMFPIIAVGLIVMVHGGDFIYTKMYEIYEDPVHKLMINVEMLLFVLLAVTHVVVYSICDTATKELYLKLGDLMVFIVIMITVMGLGRTCYFAYRRCKEKVWDSDTDNTLRPSDKTAKL